MHSCVLFQEPKFFCGDVVKFQIGEVSDFSTAASYSERWVSLQWVHSPAFPVNSRPLLLHLSSSGGWQ